MCLTNEGKPPTKDRIIKALHISKSSSMLTRCNETKVESQQTGLLLVAVL